MKSMLMVSLLSVSLMSFSTQAQESSAKNPQKNSKEVQIFEVDPAHTSIVFGVDHLGFSNVYGMISGTKGEFSLPESEPQKGSLTIEAQSNTIYTGLEKRDNHLKSPDFFNVKQYPTISFKSTKVEKLKNGKYKMTGNLTLHGKTNPVTFEFTKFRTGQGPQGKTRTGGEARFSIKRSEFGMNYMQGKDMLSDEVSLIVSIEGVQK